MVDLSARVSARVFVLLGGCGKEGIEYRMLVGYLGDQGRLVLKYRAYEA